MIRPLSTPHDAEFLFRRAPVGEPSTGCHRGFHGEVSLEQDLRGVDVRMGRAAALCADERALRATTESIDVATSSTGLAAVGRVYAHETSTAPAQLVLKQEVELTPRRICNAAGEAFAGANHVVDPQVLDDDGTVALGVVVREDVQNMAALVADLLVESTDASFRFLPVFAAFLAARDGSLCAGKAPKISLKMARVFSETVIAVGKEAGNPNVDGDNGVMAVGGGCNLDLARDAGEPTVTILNEGARLWRAFDGAMKDRAEDTQLREDDCFFVQAPLLGVGLAEAQYVSVLLFPAGPLCQLLKAALPSAIEIDQELGADISWDVSQPRRQRSERRQLANLIEGGEVDGRRSAQAEQALLEGEVPEPPQGILPSGQPSELRRGWVHSVAKGLATEHAISLALVYGDNQRIVGGLLPALNGGVSAEEDSP